MMSSAAALSKGCRLLAAAASVVDAVPEAVAAGLTSAF